MKQELNLAFFDMDGCLFDTPHPENGKHIWSNYYRKPYPHIGWWGRLESMDLNVFTIKPRPHVYEMWKELYEKGFETRVLTSRMPKFESIIQTILCDNDINMEEVLTSKGSLTKGQRILQIVNDAIAQGFVVKEVQFFDDRMKEIVTVEALETVLDEVAVQLLKSVMVTVYVPAVKALISSVVRPLFQRKV
jgi:hypothetical protein